MASVTTLLKNHKKAEDDFQEVAMKSEGTLTDRTVSASIMSHANKHTHYLDEYGELNNFLQIQHLSLSSAIVGWEDFANEVRSDHGVKGNSFEQYEK